jgi:hypothetical protein
MIQRAFVVAVAAAIFAAPASPAYAQLIQREKDKQADAKADAKADGKDGKAAKDGAKKGDDDDILAPVKDPKAKPDAAKEPAKAKSFKVGVVALVPIGEASKPLADSVTAGVLKEFNEGSAFDAVPLAVDVKSGAGATSGTDEAAAKKALDDGKALLAKGEQLSEALKFGNARKAFEQALEQLEKAAPVLADAQPLIDARVGLAEVAAKTANDSEVDIQLAYAAALNPEQDLDKNKYPPQFVRSHQKARDRILKENRGTVVVDASGAGAAVQIDGRETAGAPVKITEVPVGRHLIRAVREGLPSYGVVVEVKSGAEASVSPGFIAKDGTSYVDDLQNNRLTPAAAKTVAEAAKAAGLKGAIVGVASKSGGSVPVQLVLVDADKGTMAKLPSVTLEESLLDLSIAVLKARESVESVYAGEAGAPKLEGAALASLIEGAKAGAAAEMSQVALRFDVRAVKERPSSRLVDKPKGADGADGEDEDGRSVLSAGSTGKRQRIEDESDPYANRETEPEPVDPEAPLTEQPWFWPTVIGGGAGALVLLGAGTYAGLVGAKLLPDPRPTSGASVTVVIPQ